MRYFLLLAIILLNAIHSIAQEVIIQENETGFCSVDGGVLTSVSGYTGTGYADTDRGVGKSVSWYINVSAAGTYSIKWRYGNGGGSGDRPARLLINHVISMESINFPHTGVWTNWTETDPLDVVFTSGNNKIRIEAHSSDGLGNIDYIKIIGIGITPAECIPSYILTVNQNNELGGTVSYEPVQPYYDEGTAVTVRAHTNPGYFFQSWSGDATSVDSIFTFSISGNTVSTAIFLPIGTEMDPDIIGYATVQDDKGTPCLVIGGSLGDTVEATTFEELENFLGDSNPHVVIVPGQIIGTEDIKVRSHKTLLGIADSSHLQGIELEINEAQNVIIRNMKISHVTPADAVIITGQSKNVWIDHCELFSDRDHGQDYYDGLLDIKNESSFITVSWCIFHDHYKTSLISSGDGSVQDTVIRVTYHHNYFYNCSSRLPSIRFGKAHVFNNYYKNCDSAINSRMGACVRVEKNYFNEVGTAVMMTFSPEKGGVQLIDNHFGTSIVFAEPTCELNIPYNYSDILDETDELPLMIGGDDITSISENTNPLTFSKVYHYPNPFNSSTTIHFTLKMTTSVKLKIFNIFGQEIVMLINDKYDAGEYQVHWDASGLAGGLYLYQFQTHQFFETKKMILIK